MYFPKPKDILVLKSNRVVYFPELNQTAFLCQKLSKPGYIYIYICCFRHSTYPVLEVLGCVADMWDMSIWSRF